MSNPNINLQITERDEAGAVTATYIHSSRQHGASGAKKQTLARIDVIVCPYIEHLTSCRPVVMLPCRCRPNTVVTE